jgi:hypothetical protein
MQETEHNFHAQYTFAVNYRCFHVNKKKGATPQEFLRTADISVPCNENPCVPLHTCFKIFSYGHHFTEGHFNVVLF